MLVRLLPIRDFESHGTDEFAGFLPSLNILVGASFLLDLNADFLCAGTCALAAL